MVLEKLNSVISSLKQKLTATRESWKTNVRDKLPGLSPSVLTWWLLIVNSWLLLLLMLTACSTPSMPSSKPAANPLLPAPQETQPSEPYLLRVQRNIEAWEKLLQATLPTR